MHARCARHRARLVMAGGSVVVRWSDEKTEIVPENITDFMRCKELLSYLNEAHRSLRGSGGFKPTDGPFELVISGFEEKSDAVPSAVFNLYIEFLVRINTLYRVLCREWEPYV